MPLIMASVDEIVSIVWIGGEEEVERHLGSMGLVPGTHIAVILINNGNMIVGIKESRAAINKKMVGKIMV